MYQVIKRMEIAGSHKLKLPYESKCSNLHGHNWIVTVTCQSDKLNADGMVLDFTHIKKIVNKLDHANLNDFVEQPTAENLAKWIYDQIPLCSKVEIQEAEGNIACYTK